MGIYAYARVSSDRQEQEETILSQVAELRARASEDGVGVGELQEITDEGYSRDDPVRPGLDVLRDRSGDGDVDRLYIQAMDRLASGALLVILVEEFQKNGVEVVFLKGSVEDSPEGKFFLHIQGAAAEYERTKIAERTRRGKLYWARQGALVGGHAPYGYRFVRRDDTRRAHLEVDEAQAPAVRDMYRWLVEEQMSTRGIARRLTEWGTPTARGAIQWQPIAVDRMLRNPSYKGTFLFQRNQSVLPGRRLTNDPYQRRRKTGRKPRPEEDWISIPVPSIIEESLWEAAQAQLLLNSQHSPRNNTRHEYLLRGLVRCARCGGAYTGYCVKAYRGYKCARAHPASSSTGQRCPPGGFPAQAVEDAVWGEVTMALRNPEILKQEYQRILEEASSPPALALEQKQLKQSLRRLKTQEDRITDAYVHEAMELDRYKTEMAKLKGQRTALDRSAKEAAARRKMMLDTEEAINSLDRFCRKVTEGLEQMTFEERHRLLQLVVDRVTVEGDIVRIETVLPLSNELDQLRTRSW